MTKVIGRDALTQRLIDDYNVAQKQEAARIRTEHSGATLEQWSAMMMAWQDLHFEQDVLAPRRAALGNGKTLQLEQARVPSRLDEPLTRREVIEAIDAVASDFGGSGDPAQDLINDAFRKLAERLA